jgi:phage terminase large subunit GpA-like protein
MMASQHSTTSINWKNYKQATEDQVEWLFGLIDDLPLDVIQLSPSQCVEANPGGRYLSQATSPLPGYYSFSTTPFLREICDCFDINNPIREVAFMKGAQIGATTLLENIVFYCMKQVKNAPVMLLTADDDLAKARLDGFIMPMINDSGLADLIKSQDEGNSRKTGQTAKKISWFGGGSLLPTGAVNPNKSRSFPIRFLLRDEVDGYKLSVGADGCPLAISEKRTTAFKQSYKIFDVSTPTLEDISKINDRFKRGDQRYYHVRCLSCGFSQQIRWSVTRDDGRRAGIVWETESGRLVPGSARWLCVNCLRAHTDSDKVRLLDPSHGAEWIPYATPVHRLVRSYHLSGLYSPPGMNPFDNMVLEWLEAWDVAQNKPKDVGKSQAFYNTILGMPWRLIGARVSMEQADAHRRTAYSYGEIPNKWALTAIGSKVLFLVCTVDVHDANLRVAVWGWGKERRVLLIDYWEFKGTTDNLDDPDTWGALREVIENREYMADDGTRYRLALTLVDAGDGGKQEIVKTFCNRFPKGGVFPAKGRKTAIQGGFAEFAPWKDASGHIGFHLTVDFYKNRWYAALKRGWDGDKLQPDTFFNAPIDATPAQLKQLTVEVQEPPAKGSPVGSLAVWRRPEGADNTLWDLLVYANAAHDIVAFNVEREHLEKEFVDYEHFWDLIDTENWFRIPPSNVV